MDKNIQKLCNNPGLSTLPVVNAAMSMFVCNKGEAFKSSKNAKNSKIVINPIVHIVSSIVQTIVLLGALYLSFKCNKGFNLGSVLLACCCPICYLAYRLAIPCL